MTLAPPQAPLPWWLNSSRKTCNPGERRKRSAGMMYKSVNGFVEVNPAADLKPQLVQGEQIIIIIIIIIINPLTVRIVGHYRWFHNQFPPVSPVLHCSLGLNELQACPFPEVVFPPLPLPALSSSPFHCALQNGFGQTWWTIPLQFASLYDDQEVFVWSNCLLYLGKDFLIGNMIFVSMYAMCSITISRAPKKNTSHGNEVLPQEWDVNWGQDSRHLLKDWQTKR